MICPTCGSTISAPECPARIDPELGILFVAGYEIQLTVCQSLLMQTLIKEYPSIVARQELRDIIYQHRMVIAEVPVIGVHIQRLRKKLWHTPLRIHSIRGRGMRLKFVEK